MKIGINWIHSFSPSLKGKWENLLHYSVEPIYPEYSQIPCTKHGYISSVHLQYCNTCRTSPKTGRPSELYNNCVCNMGAQYEKGDITTSQKQPSPRHFANQMCFQSPPPAPKAAQTTSPFKPKSTSPPLSSFIYLLSYNCEFCKLHLLRLFQLKTFI